MEKKQERRKYMIESLVSEKNHHKSLYTQTIVSSFSSTADVINAYLDSYFNKYAPLNRTGFLILQILISEGGNMIQTKLSRRVFRSRYTITKTVDILEKYGWVKRRAVKGDRRANDVTITEKGLDLIKESMNGMLDMSHLAISCLSDSEQQELRRINKRLREHVTKLIRDNLNESNR